MLGDHAAILVDLHGHRGDGPVKTIKLVFDRIARDESARNSKSLVINHHRFANGYAWRNGDSLEYVHLSRKAAE